MSRIDGVRPNATSSAKGDPVAAYHLLSDSALSKQLTTLADAGYVEIRKAFAGKRPRTSARLTDGGRTAFDRHVLALQEIVAGAAGRWPQPAGHPGSHSAAPDGEPAPARSTPDQRFPGQPGQG
jgi:hypothetical protein